MPSQTNEQALESLIETILTGTNTEAIRAEQVPDMVAEPLPQIRSGHGYGIRDKGYFDARYALDQWELISFLETTQLEELNKLRKQPDWKPKLFDRIDRTIKKYGLPRLLRKGIEVDDASFTLFYTTPLASSSEEQQLRFSQNSWTVMRQVAYSTLNTRQELDMVLFLNGIPFATIELKNPWTGQTAKVHGQKQYKYDRDITQTLLQFGRCLVHFTLDTDEVYMTTKLDGANTFFLPFNKGNNAGKGNPVNPNGHRSAYFWEEILMPRSIANIFQHFVRLDGAETDALAKRTLYFPRYHQLDVVRKLMEHASTHGVGARYLIQHSAGSGKSNSITWTAYQLIECYPKDASTPGSRGMDVPLFDSVIVVTDRRLLDKQLRDNIKDFSQVKNIVAPAMSSKELKEHLEAGKRIITTTIQKFPFIVDGIADLSDRRFAVIIDEAHSSQGGLAADKLNQSMAGVSVDPDEVDVQDRILEILASRRMRKNASYLAFTATPKNNTLEKFGVQQPDGSFREFHLYSMKQAIEEGFILDVLANYTTYRSYYEIHKSISDNPEFDNVRAQKQLRKFVEQNKLTIAVKAEMIVTHFMDNYVKTKKLKGKAKAMVVTQSIESAIRYFFAIRTMLNDMGDPTKAVIAFSGKKTVDGIEYTEDGINGFAEKDTRDKFDSEEYRILVVANKYLTGFDQPKLSAMYVDKKLQGVLAVQALSRLNRAADKLGKKTEDLLVLDFYNSVDDIRNAFDPYYTSTTLSEPTDVNVLHELKSLLDDVGVYEWPEVEEFFLRYFAKEPADQLSPIIETAADRFIHQLDLDDDQKADFKIKAKQFVKIYGQVCSIMQFDIPKWEMLFWYLKFLIPKLTIERTGEGDVTDLLESVDLSTYALERTQLNTSIALDEATTELDPQNANPRGAHAGTDEKDPLDLIVTVFNERWFQAWQAAPEEQKVKLVQLANSIRKHPDFASKYADNPDKQNRELAFDRIFADIMAQNRKTELDLYRLLTTDEGFKLSMVDTLKRILSAA
jgi:type I restriction enzyme, R subunit